MGISWLELGNRNSCRKSNNNRTCMHLCVFFGWRPIAWSAVSVSIDPVLQGMWDINGDRGPFTAQTFDYGRGLFCDRHPCTPSMQIRRFHNLNQWQKYKLYILVGAYLSKVCITLNMELYQ